MKGQDRDKLNALVLGTLIGVSLIADSLVRAGVIERDELVEPLVEAESLAKGERQQALSALRQLVEKGYEREADSGANDP
jgi:hypothetical protein